MSDALQSFGKRWNTKTKSEVAFEPEAEILSPEAVPLDIPAVDLMLGGGIPRGRTSILIGEPSSGKTLLSQLVIAAAQRHGGTAMFFDIERTYDAKWFALTGVDTSPEKLLVVRPKSMEQTFDMVIDALKKVKPAVIVVDSIPAMVPQDMMKASMEDKDFRGLSARKITEGVAKATQYNNETALIFINQLRINMCIDLDTPVLTSDLRWVPAGTVKVGDQLLAFDEYPRKGTARSGNLHKQGRRCFRFTEATSANIRRMYAQRIELDNGDVLWATPEHRWLTGNNGGWAETRNLVPGKSRICKYFPTCWDENDSYGSGYLAAAFDGEGALAANGQLLFAQNQNEMVDFARSLLADDGFNVAVDTDGKLLRVRMLGGIAEVLKFLGRIRPKRLLPKLHAVLNGRALRSVSKPLVVSVGDPEIRPMAVLSTKAQTFFAGGYGAHNSVKFGNPESMPGGKGLRFHASLLIRVRRGTWLTTATEGDKDEDGFTTLEDGKDAKRIGFMLRLRTEKNKCAPPWQDCELKFFFNGTIDPLGSLIHLAQQRGIIEVTGSWFKLPGIEKKLHGLPAVEEAIREDEELKARLVAEIQGQED